MGTSWTPPLGAAHARRRTLAAPILGFARSVIPPLRHPGCAEESNAGSRARAAPRSTESGRRFSTCGTGSSPRHMPARCSPRHRSPPRRAAACRRSAAATVARRCDRLAVRVHLGCTRNGPRLPGEQPRSTAGPEGRPPESARRGHGWPGGRVFSTSSRAPPGPPPAGPPADGTASSSRSRARCGGRTAPSADRHRARRRCRA